MGLYTVSLISRESFDKNCIKNKILFIGLKKKRMFHWCFKVSYNDFVNHLTNTQYNMHK